jgi:hypothetical protein
MTIVREDLEKDKIYTLNQRMGSADAENVVALLIIERPRSDIVLSQNFVRRSLLPIVRTKSSTRTR